MKAQSNSCVARPLNNVNDKGPKKTSIRLIAAGPFQRDIIALAGLAELAPAKLGTCVAQRRITMAEINKLSIGKVLDKLRRNDAPQKSKLEQLDEKAEKMHEEIQRLRAATRRLKSGPRASRTGRD
jgi:hypothetical protein